MLPLDTDKAFGVPRPAPKPSQGNKKTKGRKPKEAAVESK